MHARVDRPCPAWALALWVAAPAVTCAFALGLDRGAFEERDALAGLALGTLAAGARCALRRAGWPRR